MQPTRVSRAHTQLQFRWSCIASSFLCFLFLLLAPASLLDAQALSGINGTVTDVTGAIVPGAQVVITNVATGVSTKTTTNSAGVYNATDLIPGTYTVKVEAKGFQASVHNDVGVEASRVSTVNATLQPGNTTQTVEVTENLISLNTEVPQQSTTIEPKLEAALPIELNENRGRQIEQFIFLAPGVTGGTFSHRINGGVDFQNEVLFNGVVAVQSETQGYQTNINPPFELIGQFTVLRDTFSAQYGLAQGAVNYRFTSGTNQFHGNGFEILRNDYFDARGAYNPTVPLDREHNYGFGIGGPIIKNRTFFFGTAEWYRKNATQTGFMTVPTPAMKQGDFSNFRDANGNLIPIFNPVNSTCTANGNAPGKPFIGNIIPQSCFSANSASLLKYVPNPTLPGFVNNLPSQVTNTPYRQTDWGFNIDHMITEKQTIHYSEWRNSYSNYAIDNGSFFSLNNPLSGAKYEPALGTGFFLNYAYTISPTLVATIGAGWMGEINNQFNNQLNNPFPNLAVGSTVFPNIHFDNGPYTPTWWGVGGGWPFSVNRKLGLSLDNNYLWVKGSHTLNMGVEIRRSYQDDHECQNCGGNIGFSGFTTADPANYANGSSGSAFASFLLGDVDNVFRQFAPELKLRNLAVSPYIQDDIKVNPRFTLSIGVRWDIMKPFTEVNNDVVFFDPYTYNTAAGRFGAMKKFGYCDGCANFTSAAMHWNRFSPRLGFNYQLNNKTVLQTGFSFNYLDGGAYEYGTNKVAVSYGNVLNGSFNRPSSSSNVPNYGQWDGNPIPAPPSLPFSPTVANGQPVHSFSWTDAIAPYVMQWNVGIQRELPANMFLSAAYVGNKSVHLPSQLNPPNQMSPQYLRYGNLLGQPITDPSVQALGFTPPYPGFLNDFGSGATLQQALLPYPQYGGITNNFDMTGAAMYNALQAQLEKRFSQGLSFLVSYTLSRMMSNTNSGFTSFAVQPLNKNNQAAEWTVDNNDQTNLINIAGTYELPFGPGKKYFNSTGIKGQILGGWSISAILQYSTGTPLWSSNPGGSVNVPGDPLDNGCSNCNRANIVSGVPQMFSYNNVYKGQSVLNPAAFTNPGPWVLGTAPRVLSTLRLPFNSNEDVTLAKRFYLGSERVQAQLRFTYFNLLNRVIFGGPDLTLTDPNFGKVINNQANTQRQGQAQFEITF